MWHLSLKCSGSCTKLSRRVENSENGELSYSKARIMKIGELDSLYNKLSIIIIKKKIRLSWAAQLSMLDSDNLPKAVFYGVVGEQRLIGRLKETTGGTCVETVGP